MSVKKASRRKKGFGHIYKVKETFYLQYRDANHKRCSLTLKTASGKKITEEREARAAAKKFLERQHKIQEIETREEYLEKRAKLKKLKARLTITLVDAFDVHLQKPHTRSASEKVLKVSRRYWEDFVSFLQDHYGFMTLDQVERVHAEAYIAYIRKNGRYDVMIRYNKETAPKRKPFKDYKYGGTLSNTTLNRYQAACKAVFTFLSTDLGYSIEENPFFHIKPLKLEPIDREIFSDDELSLIFRNPPPLMKAVFTIGICTGLRLGDVATLRWRDIEIKERASNNIPIFFGKEIHRITRKTKTLVHIPIEYELSEFFRAQWLISGNMEYVIPEAAEMYLGGSHTLNNRIVSYIKSLGIEKYRIIPGRKRKQSVKDFHSLRHCFCYYAGIRGVPLPIVQSIVGHLTPTMTKHYQSHADRAARKQGIALMRGLISQDGISPQTAKNTSDVLRERIIQFVETATKMQILQLNVIIDKLAVNELALGTSDVDLQIIQERKLITVS
ncbi:MAG: tyrosine-type recombinase/integrase [Victivallaceae bacterium]|nr:tyrosine-type recombinase/integrase [Victivallaceae bacterium]